MKIINYCRGWIDVCSSFADLEYQKRCWFELTGPEVSSYDEDLCHLMGKAEMLDERKEYLNPLSYERIKKLIEEIQTFGLSEGFLDLCDEEDLFKNVGWLKIAQLAQDAIKALKQYEGELKNESE